MAPRVETCEHCGGHPVNISWSSLKVWEECKQKGTLYRQGKKTKSVNVRNFFPGRVTDRVVRYWLEGDPYNNMGAMPDMVAEVIEKELGQTVKEGEAIHWKHSTDRKEVEAACRQAVTNIEPALLKYVLPYEYQVDFAFRTPLLMQAPWGMDRVSLNGYMDIIVYDPDSASWRIYDVKHTLNKSYWKDSFGQLMFYSLENQIRTGSLPVEVGFFQPLVPKEPVKRFAVNPTEVNYLTGRIQSMAWEFWSGEDEPTTNNSICTFCDVKHACKKFTPVKSSTGRKKTMSLGGMNE